VAERGASADFAPDSLSLTTRLRAASRRRGPGNNGAQENQQEHAPIGHASRPLGVQRRSRRAATYAIAAPAASTTPTRTSQLDENTEEPTRLTCSGRRRMP